MEVFSERLKELRCEHNLSQAQLAKETGLSKSAIAFWEVGARIPSAQAIIILSKFFGVSSDYLLGLDS
ncbi:MAG: helix-turn-helix domain-containing protein [Clostridiales bacterium]|nr:helix-turn-helix domain-containing protein [Clostridiales bacterium]